MNSRKSKLKKSECLSHRQIQYFKSLDDLRDGKVPPEYVHKRFLKLKEIKK